MNRKEAKKLLPVIQAFAEGKAIECRSDRTSDDWEDIINPNFSPYIDYRIKPEPKYRPFKNTEECWAEMQKHQPFGWVKNEDAYAVIEGVKYRKEMEIVIYGITNKAAGLFEAGLTFADGTPFGIKEGE